eukprot:6854520-Prymnesium_polylepis.1
MRWGRCTALGRTTATQTPRRAAARGGAMAARHAAVATAGVAGPPSAAAGTAAGTVGAPVEATI